MTWYPIELAVIQYEDAGGNPYSGAVLKAYEAGTTTPAVLATDATGGTTVGSVALNASGNPVVSGNVVIPHIDRSYKLVLYPSQAAADANSGATWTIDNLTTIGKMISDIVGVQQFTTGDIKFTLKTAADAGWIMCNDGTIGNAASSATTRANADTEALFALLWNNVSDTYAPVSSGRGASAAADFAANKTITLTRTMGRALAVAGGGSGLTARIIGQYLGEESHALSSGELAAHNHTVSVTDPGHAHTYNLVPDGSGGGVTTPAPYQSSSAGSTFSYNTSTQTTGVTATTANTGSGTAHNIMQPTAFLNAMIKL